MEQAPKMVVPMAKAPPAAALVLAGCQSLVVVEGRAAGDPVESAAMKAIRWEVPAGRPNTARPKPEKPPKSAATPASGGSALAAPAAAAAAAAAPKPGPPINVNGVNVAEIEIQTRHHFSSALQRMSVVARSSTTAGSAPSRGSGWVLAKGSPEAVANLLAPGAKPADYDKRAAALAQEGMRVLALAYRRLTDDGQVRAACADRAVAEQGLTFAGFVAFTCRVRRDTADVLLALREGGHSVAMVTGDALLTALHVAKEVGITDTSPPPERAQVMLGKPAWQPPRKTGQILVLEQQQSTATAGLVWCNAETGDAVAPFDAAQVPELAKTNDLAVTGAALAAAAALTDGGEDGAVLPAEALAAICVFARMRPDTKERVIATLRAHGRVCLMCGDGANDVGALKQAEVGVALLSGFGDVNTDRGDSTKPKLMPITSQAQVDELRAMTVAQLRAKLREAGIEPTEHADVKDKNDYVRLLVNVSRGVAADRAALTPAQQREELARKRKEQQQQTMERFQKTVAELEAKGESFAAVKAAMLLRKEEATRIQTERKKHGGIEGSASQMAALMDGLEEGETPMVKIGDASVAAPFTSKMPSIRGCVDIVRQGRCTLVTSMQMYQILALNCLISAYSLSVLYLDGVKYGDKQMTAQGILMSASFIAISRSKPLDRLSTVRPLTSIFSPALFLSILGQFALHLATMMISVADAKKHMPEDYVPDLDGEFKPNIINGVVFLVGAVQQVSVYVVNLKGRPFMNGLTENRTLLWSLAATFALVFMSASETVPRLNKWLQLEPFPDSQFRAKLLIILALDLGAALIWDRLMLLFFAPRILFASFEGVTQKDIAGMMRVLLIVGAIIYFLANSEDPDTFYARLEEAQAAAAAAAAGEAAPTAT
eukprot:TRINITY_DN1868_c0_g4_i1.p1 TRINITY_DN1868_c0_g4~~TRINITY_DN1868_c0_g4_i1.p1  ORF type:complete len:888 (-),score=351.93 TRINITY_DN1868_c0_g4_i1:197-2860(-)